MGRREPRAPTEQIPPSAETVRAIEGLERRLGQVETNQEDMNICEKKEGPVGELIGDVTGMKKRFASPSTRFHHDERHHDI
eukprot:8803164-Prorocentrum_lima.AAC.1